MVTYGFSLSDIRQLYIDELDDFYMNTIYVLEKKGVLKEGTYREVETKDTVSTLRRQIFGALKPKTKS